MLSEEVEAEIEALLAVFSDCCTRTTQNSIVYEHQVCKAVFSLPIDYPHCQIWYKIELKVSSKQNRMSLEALNTECENIIKDNRSDPVMFLLIEAIRQEFDETSMLMVNATDGDYSCEEGEDQKGYHGSTGYTVSSSSDLVQSDIAAIEIFHSIPYTEKRSTFQAHFSRVNSMEEVIRFRTEILSDSKYKKATHNIFAYRFTRGSIVYHDCDDDGETAAGSRLAEILRLMDGRNILSLLNIQKSL